VPFFFKQWGEWAPGECAPGVPTRTEDIAELIDGVWSYGRLTPTESAHQHGDDEPDVYRVGKRRAGRMLDGQTHDEMPKIREDLAA
jgi:protein gp37